uniref:Protein phosphatase 1 regulatory subunit n=2 Tax=Solanoideae TaxID=424551 RepID=M1CH35_SOLTU
MTSTKPSKSRPTARLPPIGTKTTTRQQVYDFSSKLLSFRPDLSMRRTRSEGTLGVI